MNWLNIYPQYMYHCEAKIVGNKSALSLLRDAIDRAIKNGQAVAGGEHRNPDGKTIPDELPDNVIFATDGEGYSIEVYLMPDDYLDPKWKEYLPFYEGLKEGGNNDKIGG